MRKILLSFFVLLTALTVQAQIVNIPDANFKNALLNHNPVIDLNADGQIQVSEAAAFAGYLDVSQKNISDLTGIAAFVNIIWLDCKNNQITSLNLNGLSGLRYLFANSNQLNSLSLGNITNLIHIECRFNQLTTLALTNLPFFRYLDCPVNQISSVTLNNLPSLQYLDLGANQLTSFPISNLPALQTLWFYSNPITTLSVSNFPALTFLHLNSCPLTSLSLSNLPVLKDLYCGTNRFSTLDLSQVPVRAVNVGGNPNLTYVNMKNGVVSSDSCTFYSNNNTLQSICADDGEISYLVGLMNQQNPGQNISVSSFCNFIPNGNYNIITGTARLDANANGCNNQDSSLRNLKVAITDGTQTGATFTNTQGNYKFFVGLNNNTVTPVFTNTWFNSTPASHSISFTNYGNTQVADFCVTPAGIHPDLEIILIPLVRPRPGFDAKYKLVYKNKGNQIHSGTVFLLFDNNKLNLISSVPPAINQPPGTLSWPFTGLTPFETRFVNLTFHVNAPPVVNGGDTLSFIATINHFPGEETPGDNKFHLNQIVVNSFDPNDKQVTEGSQITIDKLGDYLHYVIRFQNTGTANAISVIVKDSLSANLDWNSFEPIIASHPYRTTITKGYLAEFIFDGINLPPKIVNEPASNGFVAFKIKPKNNLVIGDSVQNSASIFFDFNLPIETNTVITKIYKPVNNSISGITVYSNPAKDWLSFSVKPGVEIKAIHLFNMMGQKMNIRITESTATNRKIDVSSFANGAYFLELVTNLGKVSQKVMILK